LTNGVTDDAFLGGMLRILQPLDGYRAGLDAILLAAALQAKQGEQVLDVGAGVGAVGLALARRLAEVEVTLVERDGGLVGLARCNIDRNGLAGRACVLTADVTRPLGEMPELSGRAESFDHALANPPYHEPGRGTAAGAPLKAAANAMSAGALERWLRFMAAMVRPGGTVTLIHRPDALQELLTAFGRRFGGVIILPIHPRHAEPASRLLLRAIKGSRAGLEMLPGLILHGADNRFRPEIEAILRHGAALDLHNARAEP
jgi:tRNA1(Val) A37 N6-methylase TrmN6